MISAAGCADARVCHPERERGAWAAGRRDEADSSGTRPSRPSLTLGVTKSHGSYPAASRYAVGNFAKNAITGGNSRESTHSPILCVFCSIPGPMPSMAG